MFVSTLLPSFWPFILLYYKLKPLQIQYIILGFYMDISLFKVVIFTLLPHYYYITTKL